MKPRHIGCLMLQPVKLLSAVILFDTDENIYNSGVFSINFPNFFIDLSFDDDKIGGIDNS